MELSTTLQEKKESNTLANASWKIDTQGNASYTKKDAFVFAAWILSWVNVS